MKSIYSYYKQRLIEISGKNRSLFSRTADSKYTYDLGKLFEGDYDEINSFIDFLWNGKRNYYSIIDKNVKDRLYKNLKIDSIIADEKLNVVDSAKLDKIKKDEYKKEIQSNVIKLKNLKRDVEEFSKETGRYELSIGYPFVEGAINKDIIVKAPLLLFPVVINIENDNEVSIELKRDELIKLNRVLILAYCEEHRIDISEMNLDFENLLDYKLKNVEDVLNYLKTYNIDFKYSSRKGLIPFDKSKIPMPNDELVIRPYCVMGRYPLANSIYNDYEKLEKSKLTNDAIAELLENKNIIVKQGKQDNNLYTINQLDYAQEEAIKSLNIKGNLVIYGPPGTGKSQTIVNIISEALCKNKKVLVVSQKKAALDVVYNRLGLLNSKAMFLTDSEKGKAEFYDRVKTTHLTLVKRENVDYKTKYDLIQREIEREKGDLETISDTLFSKTSFGLTLQEMYANSYIIGKKSNDYETYKSMLKNEELMKLNYNELSDCLRVIKEKNKDDLYYKFIQLKKKNPLIDYVKPDIEAHILNESQILISKLINQRTTPFDMAKYKYSREVIAYAFDGENKNSENLLPLVKFVSATKYPKLHKMLALSAILFPTYPFVRHKVNLLNKDIQKEFDKTLNAIDEYITSYKFLSNVLTEKGYVMTLDNVLNGNDLFLKLLQDALNSYVEIREMNMAVNELTDSEKVVLKFAYKNSKNNAEYKNIINKLMVIRIYHEVVSYEDVYKTSLAKIMNYDNTRNRIISLINEQKLVAKDLCLDNFTNEYLDYYSNSKNNKDYLYQITKQQGLWPIRKIMENFGDYLFKLFPCWLLSPESVSTILPLKKNLFDIVLFDEASQVFIENTIPTIYRGKNIVVAGDSKQLRPTSTFIKRYLGNDNEDDLDLNTQAALEVESLLDLAQSRYTSSYLTYHYRSKSEELINFSNYAFYDGRLEIAPNISKNASNKPIERILVEGKWIDRKNDIEAEEVVALIKKVLKTRNNNQSIGIITFNIEQEQAIEDKIDEETRKDEWFRNAMLLERNRKENGEDTSIFVKNLENVQGDERDVIIFSIGYAKNEYGKVVARFGPLSIEGGENRLNVAITRAKEKIYVVTSIEPEELVVEGSKNNGPKLFKNYLKYVRAVSENRMNEAQMILNEYSIKDEIAKNATIVAKQIKEELESLGYKVDLNVGNSKYKISLGIYDNKLNTYLLGIECDSDAYNSSTSIIERDVYRPVFLSSRNWKLVRVWSRDWWLNKNKVIDKLSKMIEQNRQNFIAQKHNRKKSK